MTKEEYKEELTGLLARDDDTARVVFVPNDDDAFVDALIEAINGINMKRGFGAEGADDLPKGTGKLIALATLKVAVHNPPLCCRCRLAVAVVGNIGWCTVPTCK
jgi:hypothetical protein